MKLHSIITTIAIGGIVLGSLTPAFAQTSTSSISSLQAIIQSLQTQLATLHAQVDALNNARAQVDATANEIKSTLKLISQLREGASGDDVTLLQTILASNSSIYPEGLVTGYFGKLTAKAVKRFQKLNGLDQVGIVGLKTLEKLNKELEKNPLAREDNDDADDDNDENENVHSQSENKKGRFCAIVPPGHLIAPGWLRKHDAPLIPTCQTLPPGIIWQFPTSTTPDVTAPIISSQSAASITPSSFHVLWSTNELANSTLWISTSSPVATGSSTPAVISTGLVLWHDLTASGLSANTTYYYVVGSADGGGNMSTSNQSSFTTLPPPDITAPVISSISSTSTTATSTHIVWTTNELANSKVTYSTSTPVSLGTPVAVADSALVTTHNLILPSLNASTTYYFFVTSQDAASNSATSSESSFTTIP